VLQLFITDPYQFHHPTLTAIITGNSRWLNSIENQAIHNQYGFGNYPLAVNYIEIEIPALFLLPIDVRRNHSCHLILLTQNSTFTSSILSETFSMQNIVSR